MVREKGLEPLHLGRKNLNLVRLPISPLPLSEHIFQSRHGVADGARTHDNRNHNPGLYQLSYSHHRERNNLMARPEGVEPSPHSLEGCCSIQLS